MPSPSKPSSYLERLVSPQRQKSNSDELIRELWDVLEEREADYEAYICLIQRGRIAMGFLERTWYLSEEWGRLQFHNTIYAIRDCEILEHRFYQTTLDPFLDRSRKEAKKRLRQLAGGGATSIISAVHFPFRKPVIIDYQLSWMRMRKGRKRR